MSDRIGHFDPHPPKNKVSTRPIAAVDFDRVIHDIENPVEGKSMGRPLPGAKETLEWLQEQGIAIVVVTLRATQMNGSRHVQDWLDYYDIPYNSVSGQKPNAIVYIDDRGLHFKDWKQTKEELMRRFDLDE